MKARVDPPAAGVRTLAIRTFRGKGKRRSGGHDWQPGRSRDYSLAAGVPLDEFISRELVEHYSFVVRSRPRSVEAERYRRLVSILERDHEGETPRVVAVTSALPGEGKTTTAINLALAFAENPDQTTLLLDADLRRPALSRFIKPEPKFGLRELLQDRLPFEYAAMRIEDASLSIVPAGVTDPNPLRLFRSENFAQLLTDLRGRFDRIVIDTPPAVPFADASLINGLADGCLVVVRSEQTARSYVDQAVKALAATGPVLGAVLNDIKATVLDRYYYGYYGYDLNEYYQEPRSDEEDEG